MQIGAIGAQVYTPYIYNTNTVNRASMNKIQGIGDDVLASKTDFSGLTSGETTNPLKRGETLDFSGILGMQMQMGRMNAARFLKEPEQAEEVTQAAGLLASDATSQLTAKAQETVQPAIQPVEQTSNASSFDFMNAASNYQPIDMFI